MFASIHLFGKCKRTSPGRRGQESNISRSAKKRQTQQVMRRAVLPRLKPAWDFILKRKPSGKNHYGEEPNTLGRAEIRIRLTNTPFFFAAQRPRSRARIGSAYVEG